MITTNFSYCSFYKFSLYGTGYNCTFKNIKLFERSSIIFLEYQDIYSMKLMSNFFDEVGRIEKRKPFITNKETICWSPLVKEEFTRSKNHNININDEFLILKDLFIYGLKEQKFTFKEIIDSYDYNSEETEKHFSKLVYDLENELN